MTQTKTLKQRWQEFVRQDAKSLIITALVLFAFRSAIADWNDVPSGSMQPTILIGDRIFVNKLAYDLKIPFTTWHLAQWGDPRRGEIVTFFSPADGKRLVKRVIGLPGDRIELRHDQLLLNDQPVQYQTLAPNIINQIVPADQPNHQYATEELATHPHPVMTTPRLPAPRDFGPVTVPPGQYFMMGDNRDNSYDSRFYGTVPRSAIVGRATTVVMSLDHDTHYLPRWRRFFTPLP